MQYLITVIRFLTLDTVEIEWAIIERDLVFALEININ